MVPKLHIRGHELVCQQAFALHFLPGAGQTDGEGIERHWASLGPIATSTVEMGPGHRRDTIDDHLSSSNWVKIIGLGTRSSHRFPPYLVNISLKGFLLRRRRRHAREQVQVQTKEFAEFCASQIDMVPAWMSQVQGWEDKSLTANPYATVHHGRHIWVVLLILEHY